MRISDWSSDVCSSDLPDNRRLRRSWIPACAGMTIAVCIALFLPALAHAQAAGVAAPAGPSAVQFAADALSGSAAPGARQPLSLSLQVLVLMKIGRAHA